MTIGEAWWLALYACLVVSALGLASMLIAAAENRLFIRWEVRSMQEAEKWLTMAFLLPGTAYVAAALLTLGAATWTPPLGGRGWLGILAGFLVIELIGVFGVLRLRPRDSRPAAWRTWDSERIVVETRDLPAHNVSASRARTWSKTVVQERLDAEKRLRDFPRHLVKLVEADVQHPLPGLRTRDFWQGTGVYATFTVRQVWAHAGWWAWLALAGPITLIALTVPLDARATGLALAITAVCLPALHQGVRGRYLFRARSACRSASDAADAARHLLRLRRTGRRIGGSSSISHRA